MKKFNIGVFAGDCGFNSTSIVWAEDIFEAVDKAKAMANLMGVENIATINVNEDMVAQPKKDYRDEKIRRYHEELEACEDVK